MNPVILELELEDAKLVADCLLEVGGVRARQIALFLNLEIAKAERKIHVGGTTLDATE